MLAGTAVEVFVVNPDGCTSASHTTSDGSIRESTLPWSTRALKLAGRDPMMDSCHPRSIQQHPSCRRLRTASPAGLVGGDF